MRFGSGIRRGECRTCGAPVIEGVAGSGYRRERVTLDVAPIARTPHGPADLAAEAEAHESGRRTYLVALGVIIRRGSAGRASTLAGAVHASHECEPPAVAARRRTHGAA